MAVNPLLDLRRALHPGLVSSIKGVDSVAVFGAGSPCELPLAMFQVLMAFAESATPREVFARLEVDVDLAQFATIIGDFCDRGLLIVDEDVDGGPDLGHALAHRLGDAKQIGTLTAALQHGRAVAIPNALPVAFAERVYQALDGATQWAVDEGGHDFFHYRNSALARLDAYGGALAEANQLFCSRATRRFIAELSGQDCGGPAYAAGAWYRPGDWALPHDDTSADGGRTVAYIWYLTKSWRREWGGSLFWGPTGQFISPGFNVLVLFTAIPANVHCVCPVSATATAKRFTVNGFWHRASSSSTACAISPDVWISSPAYGPDNSIIVL